MGVQLPLIASPALLRIDAEQFGAMVAVGAFTGLPRVELRDGLLCQMSPQHFPHAAAKDALSDALHGALRELNLPLLRVTEVSVQVSSADVPIPDIVVVQHMWFSGAVPLDHVRLVIEVSDSTLADDLGRKRELYAGGGIPEYWVVDLGARAILQHWLPSERIYGRSAVVPFGSSLASATITGLVVPTATLDIQPRSPPG